MDTDDGLLGEKAKVSVKPLLLVLNLCDLRQPTYSSEPQFSHLCIGDETSYLESILEDNTKLCDLCIDTVCTHTDFFLSCSPRE